MIISSSHLTRSFDLFQLRASLTPVYLLELEEIFDTLYTNTIWGLNLTGEMQCISTDMIAMRSPAKENDRRGRYQFAQVGEGIAEEFLDTFCKMKY